MEKEQEEAAEMKCYSLVTKPLRRNQLLLVTVPPLLSSLLALPDAPLLRPLRLSCIDCAQIFQKAH